MNRHTIEIYLTIGPERRKRTLLCIIPNGRYAGTRNWPTLPPNSGAAIVREAPPTARCCARKLNMRRSSTSRVIRSLALLFMPAAVFILVFTGQAMVESGLGKTLPPDTLHFAVIGDYGYVSQSEAQVSSLVHSWNPDLVITTGDNNYDYGAASTIDPNIGQYYHDFIFPYTGIYGSGAPYNKFFPSLGNHDWNTVGAAPYLNFFTLPNTERYYDFAAG